MNMPNNGVSENKTPKNKSLIKFFIFSYLIFWILLAITGLTMALSFPPVIITILSNVAAWAPTFALLVLFKKISPDISFWDYVKKAFSRKIKIIHFVFSLGIQLLIIVFAIIFYLIITKQELQTLAIFPFTTILLSILIGLTSGPLGEELGWREYALNIFQQKHSPLKSSIILGILWGFWHLPLWLLSGYTGVDLILYIVGFMVGIIATSVLITFFYNKSRNLLIAVWIHFWFNFLLGIFDVSTDIFLNLFLFVVLFYLLSAIIIVIIKRGEMTEKRKLILE